MKLKISLLLSVLLLALTCTSCGGDDEPEVYSLKGTRWSAELSAYAYLVIEFASDSEVIGYYTNVAGGVSGSVAKGRYIFNGTKVSFSDFEIKDLTGSNHYVDGIFEGSNKTTMVLNYWWEWSGTRYSDTVRLRKQ